MLIRDIVNCAQLMRETDTPNEHLAVSTERNCLLTRTGSMGICAILNGVKLIPLMDAPSENLGHF